MRRSARLSRRRPALWFFPALGVALLLVAACGGSDAGIGSGPGATAAGAQTAVPASQNDASEPLTLTVYSGRSETLVGPVIEQFREATGIDVEVKYGSTGQIAATLLEEGDRTPADVFFAQDAGALGAVSAAGMLAALPDALLERVEPRFRSARGEWIGVSGRARVVVYNTEHVRPEDLPDSVMDFVDPKWKGRIGWPPTNASFQAFVTAMRLMKGDEATKRWLQGIIANQPKVYKNNSATVQAAAAGEIDVGFVNHYYLYRFLKEEGPAFAARNYYPKGGDVGALVNVAGVGIIAASEHREAATRFVEYLLSEDAQRYFADTTFEYPLAPGVPAYPDLAPLSDLATPDIDLSDLSDLEGTLRLLREAGVF